MTLTDLERDRLKRIEENNRRMAEALGDMSQYNLLMCAPFARRTSGPHARAPASSILVRPNEPTPLPLG